MPESDKLRQLRRDFEQLLERAEQFRQRLEAVESEGVERSESESPPSSTPEHAAAARASLTPPPLPKRTPPPPIAPPPRAATPEAKEEARQAAARKVERLLKPVPQKPVLPLPERVSKRLVAMGVQEETAGKIARLTTKDGLVAALKGMGPDESMSWEMALGTFWLPRVGMLVLAVGVVLLTSLAMHHFRDAWWIPHARLGMGYAICAVLLVAGKRLESRMPAYARVLLIGGLGLTYFMTFATHFVPFTRVIDRPEPTLVLLGVIVVIWLGLAQARRSVWLACGVTLLGHFTVALSTHTLAVPSRFAIAGLLLLSVASGIFLAKNRWYYVGAAGLLAAYANYAYWLANSPPSGLVADFIGSMGILAAHFVIYALAEVLASDRLRRTMINRWVRALYVSANSACFLGLGLKLMYSFDFTRNHTYVSYFYFSFSAALLALGFLYLKLREKDPLHNTYFTKASAIAVLGLAAAFDGPMLTLSLAIEAAVLLMSARRSGLVVTRLLAFAVGVVALTHGLWTVGWGAAAPVYGAPGYLPQLISASVAVLAFLFLSELYRRTDWIARSSGIFTLSEKWQARLSWLDLQRQAPGLQFPYLYACAAGVLTLAYGYHLLPLAFRGPALSWCALAVAGVGVALRAKPFTVASLAPLAGAVAWWHRAIVDIPEMGRRVVEYDSVVPYAAVNYWTMLAQAMAALVPLIVLAEMARLAAGGSTKLWISLPIRHARQDEHVEGLRFAYAIIAAEMAALAALVFLAPGDRTAALALGALATVSYAALSGAKALGLASMLLVFAAAVLGSFEAVRTGDAEGILGGWGILVGMAALTGTALWSEERYAGPRPGAVFHQDKLAPYFLYGATAWLLGLYLYVEMDGLYGTFALAAAAAVCAALMVPLHARALGLCATGFLVGGLMAWLSEPVRTGTNLWHLAGLAVVAPALVGDRYFAFRDAFRRKVPGAVLVAVAWVASLYYARHIDGRSWQTSWTVVMSGAMLAYGLYFRSKTAVGLSLFSGLGALADQLARSYGRGMRVRPLIGGYLLLIAFWGAWERLYALAVNRFALPLADKTKRLLEAAFVAIPCVLLVLMLERIPDLSDFYLTISWTVAALLLFGVSFVVRQKAYRYAGLLTFLLALTRVVLVDTRHLEGIYRVAAFMVLGAVLLGVAYGYVWARDRARKG